MPIHDWSRVDAGTFHDFHQDWTIELRRTLNKGILPPGYFAMADQRVNGPEPDIVTYQRTPSPNGGGLAVADAPPRVRQVARHERETAVYARKANRLSIRGDRGRVVAIIEIVSLGNKDTRHAFAAFVNNAAEFLRQNIHFVAIDLHPSTAHDPHGVHQAVWEEATDEPLEPRPADKPLSAISFDAGWPLTLYFEPLAVGDELPPLPLFLEPGYYVPMPLEETYRASWENTPGPIRDLVQPPARA